MEDDHFPPMCSKAEIVRKTCNYCEEETEHIEISELIQVGKVKVTVECLKCGRRK